jgi:predicted metal-dependent RNase
MSPADADRRELAQIELANHIAQLGGRFVLEALRAVRRGQTIISVLEDFQRIARWRGLRVVGRN